MARRVPSTNSKIKDGRGNGHGIEYKPYLTVRDVPSKGLSSRIKGWKTRRVHHFLSIQERNYFYNLEWALQVVDIREQFPLLPMEATVEIAERLSIKHPRHPQTKELIVMTTDFVIDELIAGDLVSKARTVKLAEELGSTRVLEKLEIERTYWHERGTDWGIVTKEEILEELAENVRWIHKSLDPDVSDNVPPEILLQLEQVLFEIIAAEPRLALSHAALLADRRLGLNPGTSLWAVKHLVASRQWCVDMFRRISPDKPLVVDRSQFSDMGSNAEAI